MIKYQPPPDTGPAILHADDSFLIVSKPSGLLSVPGRSVDCQDCLLSRVRSTCPEALIVHRLDMSTSGLMVMARNGDAHRNLSRQFENRLVKKKYLAVVKGKLVKETGSIALPLICDWPNRPRQIVDQINGKAARTDYRVLAFAADEDTSRVELQPTTGRTHQLRVHLQALGHPILGDDLYADESTRESSDRLLLHATALGFLHPGSQEQLFFTESAPF